MNTGYRTTNQDPKTPRRQFVVGTLSLALTSTLRTCLGTTVGSALGATTAVAAGANSRPKIGIITFRGHTDVEKGFKSYLESQGLQPIYFEYDLGRDNEKLPSIVETLNKLKPDLVLTWGTSVTLGAVGTHPTFNAPNAPQFKQSARLSCPVVFALVAAPVSSGIVPALQSNDRAITGVYHVAELESQLQAMSNYRPFKTLGMLYNPAENNSKVTHQLLEGELKKQGKSLNVELVKLDSYGKPTTDHLVDQVKRLKHAGSEWLYLPPDSFLGVHAKKTVVPAAHELGLPTFASTEQLMDAGALIGLVCSYFEVGQFAAFKAKQIIDGVFAGEIPVETLKTFGLIINSQTAKALRLTPPLPIFGVARFKS